MRKGEEKRGEMQDKTEERERKRKREKKRDNKNKKGKIIAKQGRIKANRAR
jgi:hypothetical protein